MKNKFILLFILILIFSMPITACSRAEDAELWKISKDLNLGFDAVVIYKDWDREKPVEFALLVRHLESGDVGAVYVTDEEFGQYEIGDTIHVIED